MPQSLHRARATRTLSLVALLVALLMGAGCVGRAVSEGVGGVRGVRGFYYPIRALPGDVSSYERFELGEIDDDFGGQVPDDFWDAFRNEFEPELARRRIPNAASGRTLRARGRVVHIETNNLGGLVLGDFEQVVARIELVDTSTGRVVGLANCIGRSDESVNRGVRAKGRGLAKAIAAWIDDSYPNEAKPEPEADEQ